MNWLSLLAALAKLVSTIAGALRDRALTRAGEARGRAESDADHAREAEARGQAMRQIADRPPPRAEIDKRLEEGTA
jgi:hypothetical protein